LGCIDTKLEDFSKLSSEDSLSGQFTMLIWWPDCCVLSQIVGCLSGARPSSDCNLNILFDIDLGGFSL
jgi:hypothetical protein